MTKDGTKKFFFVCKWKRKAGASQTRRNEIMADGKWREKCYILNGVFECAKMLMSHVFDTYYYHHTWWCFDEIQKEKCTSIHFRCAFSRGGCCCCCCCSKANTYDTDAFVLSSIWKFDAEQWSCRIVHLLSCLSPNHAQSTLGANNMQIISKWITIYILRSHSLLFFPFYGKFPKFFFSMWLQNTLVQ